MQKHSTFNIRPSEQRLIYVNRITSKRKNHSNFKMVSLFVLFRNRELWIWQWLCIQFPIISSLNIHPPLIPLLIPFWFYSLLEPKDINSKWNNQFDGYRIFLSLSQFHKFLLFFSFDAYVLWCHLPTWIFKERWYKRLKLFWALLLLMTGSVFRLKKERMEQNYL